MSDGFATRLARILPSAVTRAGKRVAVHPRFWAQRRACRRGFRLYGDRYPQHVLFVAGLPKSGTTWLERMVSSFPGFAHVLIPEATVHELATGGSHDYELPEGVFRRFDRALALTKMHVHGSPHNARVLRASGVRYVVLYRDLRDVVVSNYFYVSRTPQHPEFPIYRRLGVEEALALFALRTLPAYVAWVRSWHENRDPERSLEIRYERMVEDPLGTLVRVARLFELGADDAELTRIVEEHSFRRLSGGREAGQASRSFFRRGVAGDWRNHFTPALVSLYKAVIGDFLVEFGYEPDLEWDVRRS